MGRHAGKLRRMEAERLLRNTGGLGITDRRRQAQPYVDEVLKIKIERSGRGRERR